MRFAVVILLLGIPSSPIAQTTLLDDIQEKYHDICEFTSKDCVFSFCLVMVFPYSYPLDAAVLYFLIKLLCSTIKKPVRDACGRVSLCCGIFGLCRFPRL
jgi:hypothetical protein